MKSESPSCFVTLLLLIVALALIRYAIPGLWKIIVTVSAGVLSVGVLIFILGLAMIGYFTFKNLRGNKEKEEAKKFSKVSRVEDLYRSIQSRLDQDALLNQVLSEEFLQAEMLVDVKMQEIKTDLIRLKEMTSTRNQKMIEDQFRDYRQQLKEARDPAVKQVIEENLKMVQEKKDRMAGAAEEIRQQEASLDLLYHSLVKVDEELKLGRAIAQLFPHDVYARFGLAGGSSDKQEPLPPMPQKSSLTE